MADKPDMMVGHVPDALRPEDAGTPVEFEGEASGVAPAEPDIFNVRDKVDGFEYRFLNRNDMNINRKQMIEGYEIIKGDSPEIAGVRQPDGTRIVGDTVLARRPISVGDQRRARRTALREQIEGSPAKTFHEAGEAANREARDAGFTGPGVTTFETDGDGNERRPAVKPHRKVWAGAKFDSKGQLVK
jgi:hypothetical protein